MPGAIAWLIAAGFLYGPVLLKLARDWAGDSNYSHGFIVLPIALWLAWRQRHRLRSAVLRPSGAGLAIVAASLLLYVFGIVGAELFVTRISLLGVVAGSIVYCFGWTHLRIVAFPVAFLLFMIPPPTIVFGDVALALQLLASRLGEGMLRTAGVAVLRDGNVLTLGNVTLQVTEACSGIHSMMSLVTIGVLFGYLCDLNTGRRTLLTLAAIPLAIVLNGLRIAAAGVAASQFGPQAAEGPMHLASGWLIFVAGLAFMWFFQYLALEAPRRRAAQCLPGA
jgi:exosortase